MANPNAVWGIDIGQCALKALRCTLSADGETVVADKYDYIEYPKILSQPEADPEELIKEALAQFLSRNDVVGDRVAISVPGQAGLSRFFKPPPVEVKTLPDIVKYEVKQQIPFPIEDVIWDWQQLGGTIVDGRAVDAEVGLFAMKREAVYRAMQPFDDAGIEIDLVQLSPLSIFNVVCHDIIDELPNPEDFDPEAPTESTVVLSMGTDTTDLIVTNGMKLWLRNIPIGGNHFTKQLSREMKLTQAKAEHLKRNAHASENPKAIFKAMRPVFGDLVNEVQRSLTFYQSMEKSANLKEIVLLGNAAKLPGLRQFLGKQLEIDIAKVSEFRKLDGSEVIKQPTFSNNLLSFAPCYGLCIQGLQKGHVKTNLLPKEIQIGRIVAAKKPWILAAVSILLVGLVGGFYLLSSAWHKSSPEFVDANNVSFKDAIKKVKDRERDSGSFLDEDELMSITLAKLNLMAKELTSASEGKATQAELYSALSQAFPKDPRITELAAQGIDRVDPVKIPFEEREEIYLDHLESVFYKDLEEWNTVIAPIHQKMLAQKVEEETDEEEDDYEDEDDEEYDEYADEVVEPTSQFDGVPGWVIEIKGHHFHNSDVNLANLDAADAYLFRTLISNFINKQDVVMRTTDPTDLFAYSDLGIFLPTIIQTSERRKKAIVFDPTAADEEAAAGANGPGGRPGGGGQGMAGAGRDAGGGPPAGGLGRGGGGRPVAGAADDNTKFSPYEYVFVVQLAWIPRTEEERIEARAARLEAEKLEAEKLLKSTDKSVDDLNP